MARLGVLKPLRGTESSLANIVLDEGELAFSYPSTGPGTGLGGIKMGDGVKTFSSLPWYITGEGSGPTPTPWEYNTGTDETALLNNIKHPEYETLGKIYYIKSYFSDGTQSILGVPYMVIDINHENTNNTVDLISKCPVNITSWNVNSGSWTYGKYSTSNFYSWLSTTCPMGYSNNIYAKMCYMIERWKEATSATTGSKTERTTRCKVPNPYELCGDSVQNYHSDYHYTSDFDSSYGSLYTAFTNSISSLNLRIIYSDLSMTNGIKSYSNSYWFQGGPNTYVHVLGLTETGAFTGIDAHNSYGIPVIIRLSDNPS